MAPESTWDGRKPSCQTARPWNRQIATDAIAPSSRRWLMLAVCCLSLFMVGLDNTIVNVGLPSIGKTLHASIAGLQWTIASYTIVLAGLLMFSGAIADRIGRRTLFQVGLSLFTLGSWLCSLAPSLGWLIAFRVLQGIGGSMLNPSALSIITNTFTHPAERARAIGIWDGVFGLSMALGPVLGGVLISSAGWRGIFWANIPVGLAAISLTALFVPDSRSPRTRRIDPVGQVLIIIMLTSLAYAIIQGPGDGWLSPEIFGLFALSAGTLGVLLAYEPRRPEPALDFRFFRSVPFAGANLTAICAIAATAGFLFLSTLYLQDVRGFSALQTGLTLLPMPVVMAVCAPLAGRIMARSGPRVPLVIAGAALTLSSAGLTRLGPLTSDPYLVVTYGGFGMGLGMANSPITNGVMSGVPKTQAGVASGINSTSRQLGQSLGVAVTGAVLAARLGPARLAVHGIPPIHAAWLVITACGYAMIILALTTTARTAAAAALTSLADPGPAALPCPDIQVTARLSAPAALVSQIPLSRPARAAISQARAQVRAVLDGTDDRLLVIAGPCSVHDPAAALDYARRLASLSTAHRPDLMIVMRVYFEKPRTVTGWKGLINDPGMDGTHDIRRGLRTARQILADIAPLVPAGCEWLDPATPDYLADLVTWGAIGARTTESQVHRQLASGLPMPIGFKNGSDGDIQVAIDACRTAAASHTYIASTPTGTAAAVTTAGNPDTHVILRGGRTGPNYEPGSVTNALDLIKAAGLPRRVIIDASHGNSGKDHRRQPLVAADIAHQISAGQVGVAGIMLESFLAEGRQEPGPLGTLRYGQSVTDACVGIGATATILNALAAAVRDRRQDRLSGSIQAAVPPRSQPKPIVL